MTKHSELFYILTLGVMRNANTALCKAAKNSNARIIMIVENVQLPQASNLRTVRT